MSTLFLLLFNSYIILRFRCIEEMIDKIQVYDFISERLTDILISLRCNIDKDVEEDILLSYLKFRYNLHGYFQAQNHFIEEIKKFRY